MDDSTQPLRAQPTSSATVSATNRGGRRAHSPARAALASDAEAKPFNRSLWARAGACLRRALRCGASGSRARSLSAGSSFDPRGSAASQAPQTAEQIAAAKKLKQKIEKYSTMRVHMKRVQLRLEQEKRNRFYRELVVYLLFLSLVMGSLLSLPVHFPYEQNAALDDLFFDEEFRNTSIKKTFHDAMIESELWQWVDGPFVEGYYEMPIRNMRRIGSPLVRAGRVKGDLCRYTDGRTDFVLFSNEFCYPEFSSHVEFREDYGNDSTVEALGQLYTWRNDMTTLLRSQTFTPSLFNHEMDYGTGGYGIYLPRDNETAARAIFEQLQQDFLTDSTRYLAVSFAFYNPRSNIFTHIQALFEMSDTDYMETTARVKSFHILRSYKSAGFLRDNWFVIVLVFATLWLLAREFSDLRTYGAAKYVHSLWNLLDMFQLVLLIIFIERWVSYLFMCEDMRAELYRVARLDCSGPADDQRAARECFVDVEPLAWRFLSVTNYASALSLVSVAIVFKYLRLNTRLNLLWRTLRFAAKDLLAFVVIFFTIFFAYAIMGFLAFGSSVRQYHSLSVSLTSCFQMLLGAFDYNQIYVANPAMAGVFFFSFMVSVYLICINMFIAIMSEYYSLAQAEKKRYEESKLNLVGGDGTSGGGEGGEKKPPAQSDHFSESLQLVDVEYDLAKQFSSYIQGLQVRVRLPPRKDKSSVYETEQVLLTGYQRVLLVDYDYLMAERKRLKTKFRGWVQTVMTVTFMLRLVRPDFRMRVVRKLIVDKRPRASSAASYAELAEFPVTYIPVASVRANTVELLKSLKPGMFVDMDDGSLTKDQITLQVLGGQDAYIPPRYKRHEVPTSETKSDDDDLHLRISEVRDDDDDGPNGPRAFGLRHDHDGIGAASHIRCCRVQYDGDTVLDGLEACMFPRRLWVLYFLRHVVWGSITAAVASVFSRKKKRAAANRLISDADVDQLIREHFVAPGRGISCRFDELVRNFRMFIAKKAHKRHGHIQNLEERIFLEVITFLERFPTALSPLDKRELEGYKYTPQPVDTLRVRLPNSVRMLAELLAQNAHEVWAVGRIDQGWRWGPARDNEKMLHPDLIPYEALTEETKQYDRDTSIEALKVITALGYVLEPPARGEDQEFDVAFGEPAAEEGGTYVPQPIPTDSIKVPSELRSLIELLAENTHEVWAKMRMSQGWKFGPRRDDDKLEHNGLVPYIYLTHDEKQMDRNTALQTVKLILRCGFKFVHKDKLTSASHRSGRRKASARVGAEASMRAFGRSENADTKHAADAVALARSTVRAKRAFLKHGSSARSFTNRSSSAASTSSTQLDGAVPASISESHLEGSSGSDGPSRSESTSSFFENVPSGEPATDAGAAGAMSERPGESDAAGTSSATSMLV